MDKAAYEFNLEKHRKFTSEISVLDCHAKEYFFQQQINEEVMRFEFQGVMLHAAYKMKYLQPEIFALLSNVFYMFSIRIWENNRDEPDAIGIKCKN